MIRTFLTSIIMALLLVGCGQVEQENLTEVDPVEDKSTDTEVVDGTIQTEKVDTPTEEPADEPIKQQDKKTSEQSLTDLKIHYIDAGQADATLFQYTYENKPYTILYDAGDWNKNDVVNYLAAQNVAFIDLIIISHPHADHAGQLADVIKKFGVGEVWLSGNTASSQTFQRGLDAVLASDADYHEPRTGETFDIGPLAIEVLHPSSISGRLNEESLSLMFTYGDHNFLFTGDAGKKDEIEMMNSGVDMKADILQLGHHGSNTSSDPQFIKAVNPAIAIYSAGANNSYGHPHPEVVSHIQNAGITLYGTDVHGTILVTTDGKEYTIATKEDGTISPKSNSAPSEKQEKKKTEEKAEEKAANNSCVDINHASVEDIQNIIHIGPARAVDLIDLRPYDSVDNLSAIKGIGPARIADIKDQRLACVK